MLQLPLPEHVEEKVVCNSISPEKDVDGFHVLNMGRWVLAAVPFLSSTCSYNVNIAEIILKVSWVIHNLIAG